MRGMVDGVVTGERRRLRLLQASTFTSNVDRFAIAPLLVPIGLDLQASLAAVATVASVYYLAYGLAQPVWGMVSDRIGRVRVMRIALLGAAVAGACSVVAPNLVALGLTRVVTGACFAGVIPTALVYVGDVWPAATRQRPVSEVLTASATGIAIATVGAGVVADLVGWRAVPGLSAAAAAALVVALRRLPEPERPQTAGNPLRSVRAVFASGWGRLVLAIVLAEGVVVLGVLTYIAPAVQALGRSAAVAGLVAASFGVGAVGLLAAGAGAGRAGELARYRGDRRAVPGGGVGRARGVGVGRDAGRRRVRRRRVVGVPAHDPADVGDGDGAGRAGDGGRAVRDGAVPGQRDRHRRGGPGGRGGRVRRGVRLGVGRRGPGGAGRLVGQTPLGARPAADAAHAHRA